MSRSSDQRLSPRARLAAILGGLLGTAILIVVTGLFAFPHIETFYIKRAQEAGKSTLRLVAGAVDQAVGRYEPLPGLIAGDPVLREVLLGRDNSGLESGVLPFVNEKLRITADAVGASEIYLLDAGGTTIATSNYREDVSFVGQNFAYRPYFQRAIDGKATLFHALGTTSGERGFFFAAPILDGITEVGVLALKVTVDEFETAWQGAAQEILVADQNGVAFLSSSADYRLRSLTVLPEHIRDQIGQTRQFPLETVTPLSFSASVIAPGANEVLLGEAGQETRYLAGSEPLNLAGWHAIVLTPLAPVRARALFSLFVASLAASVVILAAVVLIQRRAQRRERARAERFQRDMLERRVRERTADLDAANDSLRSEIEERRNAEARLRKTQTELVQAGKLAALGQMSAALSHEINQPLAAVKSYADNAAQFLDRARYEDAGANITRISQMTDRMAKISGHLRNFARLPGVKLSAVPVGETIAEAISLVDPQLRQAGAEVRFTLPPAELWAVGGRLRLQQVLVNVMSNALDAMADSTAPVISITCEQTGDHIVVVARDRGPGLAPEHMGQVFDAFYTTKEAGEGMGLGLSISANIIEDFGGQLLADNHPEGGAVFTIKLRQAAAEGVAPLVAE